MIVVTAEETRLDILSRDLLGTEREGMTEVLLAANPGLADQGPYVAAGTQIVLPDVDRTATRVVKTVDPWD